MNADGPQTGLIVLGGSFDPPHRTHCRLAAAALQQLPAAQLLVLPAGDHPHKGGAGMAPPADRLAMCRLAFRALPAVTVDARELQRPGRSYTVDTLAALRQEHPDRTLFFVVGADNLPLLPTWREHHRLLQLCTVVTFPRLGFTLDPQCLDGLDLTATERQQLLAHTLQLPADAVSASALRAALRRGERALPDLDPAVEAYILAHHLYGT